MQLAGDAFAETEQQFFCTGCPKSSFDRNFRLRFNVLSSENTFLGSDWTSYSVLKPWLIYANHRYMTYHASGSAEILDRDELAVHWSVAFDTGGV